MIIEKNMNVKFDIGEDIVSDWMNQASKEDVLKLLEMVNVDTFDYLLANYLAKMSEDNPTKAHQFVKPFIKNHPSDDNDKSKKKDIKLSVGDHIMLRMYSPLFNESFVLVYDIVKVNNESKIFYVRNSRHESDVKVITFDEFNKRLGYDIFLV